MGKEIGILRSEEPRFRPRSSEVKKAHHESRTRRDKPVSTHPIHPLGEPFIAGTLAWGRSDRLRRLYRVRGRHKRASSKKGHSTEAKDHA